MSSRPGAGRRSGVDRRDRDGPSVPARRSTCSRTATAIDPAAAAAGPAEPHGADRPHGLGDARGPPRDGRDGDRQHPRLHGWRTSRRIACCRRRTRPRGLMTAPAAGLRGTGARPPCSSQFQRLRRTQSRARPCVQAGEAGRRGARARRGRTRRGRLRPAARSMASPASGPSRMAMATARLRATIGEAPAARSRS